MSKAPGLLLTIRAVDITGEPGRVIVATGDPAVLEATIDALFLRLNLRPLHRQRQRPPQPKATGAWPMGDGVDISPRCQRRW